MTEAVTGTRPAPGKVMWLAGHSDFPTPPDVKVRVDCARKPGGYLGLTFTVIAPIGALVWDGEGQSGRIDELWRHGCLEAFVTDGSDRYVEINLAPTTRWAAYAFDGYRAGMCNAEVDLAAMRWVPRPGLSIPRSEMSALVRLPEAFEAAASWQLNLTAVLEAADGSKSYWALAHPPGKPDFHHRDGFVLTLPAPDHS